MMKRNKHRLWIAAAAVLLGLSAAPAGVAAAGEDIPIDAAHFPDDAFRAIVSGAMVDANQDGVLSEAEIAQTVLLEASKSKIKSLKGIEVFTSLAYLDCSSNQLTELDLKSNTLLRDLNCAKNKLTALDLSRNKLLGAADDDIEDAYNTNGLDCSYNQLKKLDLSANPQLHYLSCAHNALTALDVTVLPELRELDCSYNSLKKLDVTHCPKLSYNLEEYLMPLNCSHNQLTALDLSKNKYLVAIDCSYNRLAALDVSKCPSLANTSELGYLRCGNNRIKTLSYLDGVNLSMFSYDADVTLKKVGAVAANKDTGSRAKAKKLSLGKKKTAAFSSKTGKAWYTFTAKKTVGYYAIEIRTQKVGEASRGKVQAYLFRGNGTTSVTGTQKWSNLYISRKLVKGEKYYLKIANVSAQKYTVKVTYFEDKYADTAKNAARLQAGKTYKDTICLFNDIDWFTFKAPSTGKYVFTIPKKAAGSLDFAVYDAGGRGFTSYDSEKMPYTKKLEKGKTYYLRVGGYYGGSPIAYSLKVTKK